MRITALISLLFTLVTPAWADVVTDANAKAAEIAARLPGTPIAVRAMAIVLVPLMLGVNLCFGWLYESRNYVPLLPLLALEARLYLMLHPITAHRGLR